MGDGSPTPVELRVHGVSGTPPEAILHLGPVTYDLGPGHTKVYEANRDPYAVRAYHWGSLTAGRPHTALWILLAPFALANVAGWMSERPNPWTRALIRVTGLALTGVFFAQIANMTMAIPYETRLRHAARPEVWGVVALAATAALALLTFTIASAQSNFHKLSVLTRLRLAFSPLPRHMKLDAADAEGDWEDPAEGASMLSGAMWAPHPFVHRLLRLHLAGGALVLSLVTGAGIGDALVTRVAAAGLVLDVVLMLATTWIPESMLFARLPTALMPGLALAWLGVAGWEVLQSPPGHGLAAADEVTFGLALILLVLALFALFGEWVKGGPGRGWVSLGAIAIALLVGASLGLTGGLLVEDLVASAPGLRTFEQGGAWTALAMAGLAVLLLAVAGAMAAPPLGSAATANATTAAPESRLRRVTLRSRALLVTAGVYGIATGIITALAACATGPGCDPDRLPVPSWAAEDPNGVTEALGLSFDLTSLLGWVKLVIVVLPGVLILRSILGGFFSGQEARRKVSILWDIGSFWPRWFHPLAPPAYGPSAVAGLIEVMRQDPPDVLAAHSQGSLIAVAALSRDELALRPRLLLTYGSPLGILYQRLFPQVEVADMIEAADRSMGGRWLNLWRRSDPIGGQNIATLDGRNWHVDTGSGHSLYELTPEYCAARERGLAGEWARPAQAELEDCWADVARSNPAAH